MTKRAALIDATGVFVGMAELADDAPFTDRHLPKIPECDLTPGAYRWVPHGKNPFGGEFVPLGATEIRPAEDVPSLEEVVFLIAETLGKNAPARVAAWHAWYRNSIDALGRKRG